MATRGIPIKPAKIELRVGSTRNQSVTSPHNVIVRSIASVDAESRWTGGVEVPGGVGNCRINDPIQPWKIAAHDFHIEKIKQPFLRNRAANGGAALVSGLGRIDGGIPI